VKDAQHGPTMSVAEGVIARSCPVLRGTRGSTPSQQVSYHKERWDGDTAWNDIAKRMTDRLPESIYVFPDRQFAGIGVDVPILATSRE
jgi:hypothetical protein